MPFLRNRWASFFNRNQSQTTGQKIVHLAEHDTVRAWKLVESDRVANFEKQVIAEFVLYWVGEKVNARS